MESVQEEKLHGYQQMQDSKMFVEKSHQYLVTVVGTEPSQQNHDNKKMIDAPVDISEREVLIKGIAYNMEAE